MNPSKGTSNQNGGTNKNSLSGLGGSLAGEASPAELPWLRNPSRLDEKRKPADWVG